LTAIFLAWSGRVLSAGRIARPDLMPFAILGALLLAAYSVGATVYVPHLFDTFATRYGVIGAVFAMISALFCVMVVLAGSAAVRSTTSSTVSGAAKSPPRTKCGASGTRSPPRHDHGGTCCEPRSTTAAVATATERAPSSSILGQRVPRSSSLDDATRLGTRDGETTKSPEGGSRCEVRAGPHSRRRCS
jgi:hypothetical protein